MNNLNPNERAQSGSQLQALLYVRFIFEKKHRVDVVAEKMGIATDTLYRYIDGRLAIPIDRLPDLVNATGNQEFMDLYAEKCGLILISKARIEATRKAIQKIELDIAAAQGKLIDVTETALEDDHLDKKEFAAIAAKINAAVRDLETLRESVKAKFRECEAAHEA